MNSRGATNVQRVFHCLPRLLGGLLLPACLACWGPGPLRVHVTFEELHGIEPGIRVVHRGLVVGRVTDVGLDEHGLVLVTLDIAHKYRTAVAQNSVVRVDAVGLRRRRQLVIEDGEGERIPLQEGDVLEGSEGLVDDTVTDLKDAARQVWESATDMASDLAETMRDWAESDDAKELTESLDALRRETVEQTRESWQRLRDEELPKLRQQAEELRRRLSEGGAGEEAERFWSKFEENFERLHEAAERATEQDLPLEKPPESSDHSGPPP